jgi:hypothetical protein
VSSSFSLSLLYVVSSRLNAAFVPVTLGCTVAMCVLVHASLTLFTFRSYQCLANISARMRFR